jgi:hypothetical protein
MAPEARTKILERADQEILTQRDAEARTGADRPHRQELS